MIRHRAVAAIQDEHRSLAAVIRGMEYLAGEIRVGRPADLAVLRAMLRYIRDYPEQLHHPAEDRTLFAALRKRTAEADEIVADLEAEHAAGAARLDGLAGALERLEAGAAGAGAAFADAVRLYAEFYWSHMRKEEERLLPVAERVLTEDDWRAVDHAFRGHGDPSFGEDDTAEVFRRLFSRIVALAPPPIGVGPARSDRG